MAVPCGCRRTIHMTWAGCVTTQRVVLAPRAHRVETRHGVCVLGVRNAPQAVYCFSLPLYLALKRQSHTHTPLPQQACAECLTACTWGPVLSVAQRPPCCACEQHHDEPWSTTVVCLKNVTLTHSAIAGLHHEKLYTPSLLTLESIGWHQEVQG